MGAPNRGAAELMREVLDTSIPDDELTHETQRVQRRFLRGDEISSVEVRAAGQHPTSVTSARHVLERWGYKFKSQDRWPEGVRPDAGAGRVPRYWWITNLDHTPDLDRAPRAERTSTPPSDQPRPRGRPRRQPVPELPLIGSTLQVTAVSLDDDGGVTLGLRGENVKYMVRVEGQMFR